MSEDRFANPCGSDAIGAEVWETAPNAPQTAASLMGPIESKALDLRLRLGGSWGEAVLYMTLWGTSR